MRREVVRRGDAASHRGRAVGSADYSPRSGAAAASRRRRAGRARSAPAGRSGPSTPARRPPLPSSARPAADPAAGRRSRNSKCRCGPVAQPVWPTAPMMLRPDRRAGPCATSMRLRCAYTVDALVAVRDLDDVAVAVLPAGELDDAVADAAHRRAGRRAVVDAVVLLPAVADRMHAHREARGHARELQRAGEERALLALAVEAEVAALAVAVLEPHRRVGLALVDELGGEDAAGRRAPGDRLAVGGERFVDDGEACRRAAARGGSRCRWRRSRRAASRRRRGCRLRRWRRTARSGSCRRPSRICDASGKVDVSATSWSAMRWMRRRVNCVGTLSVPGAA